jgi:MoaA/NifB/PqqE/SkfB family radical SAM enzyme
MRKEYINFEITTRCTLACPACDRTIYAGQYKVDDVPVDFIKERCKDFDHVHLIGAKGDAIYHRNFHDVISGVIEINPSSVLSITTNGSYRSKSWWEKTASILRKQDIITFSIDGLPYNNKIYRINHNWDSMIIGIDVLNRANRAKMVWKWIHFKHNENDAVEGLKLAKELGFHKFAFKETNRFATFTDELKPNISFDEALSHVQTYYSSM